MIDRMLMGRMMEDIILLSVGHIVADKDIIWMHVVTSDETKTVPPTHKHHGSLAAQVRLVKQQRTPRKASTRQHCTD